MTLVVRPAPPGTAIADSYELLDDAMLDALWNDARRPVRALGCYVERITPDHVARYTARGFGLLLIGLAHPAEQWLPTAELGAEDAARHLARLKALGIPVGATMVLDCETPNPTSSPASRIAWIDGWAQPVGSALFLPMTYMGAGMGLTSEEWEARPDVHRYGKSCSRVVDRNGEVAEPARGPSWVQVLPPDIKLGGADVDLGMLASDYRGDVVTLVYDEEHAP